MTPEEWSACHDEHSLYAELLPLYHSAEGGLSRRRLSLFAAACLRRVWPLIGQPSIRSAVEVLEEYADARIGLDVLVRTWTDCEWEAAEDLWLGTTPASLCDCQYCLEFRWDAWVDPAVVPAGVREAAGDPAWVAARAAFHARNLVAWQAEPIRRDAAVEAEQRGQYATLIDILGPPGRRRMEPAWLCWGGSAVPRLAQAIYCGRTSERAPILADALEEAGCFDDELVAHLRGPGPHARGCWAIDLILGKL